MRIALATSVCVWPCSVEQMLDRWLELRGDHQLAMAIDARIPSPLQGLLVGQLAMRGVRCCEIAHPLLLQNGRPMPSPISVDREARRVAVRLMRDTIALAERHDVPRVALQPPKLSLHMSTAQLRVRFARGEDLPLADLTEQRSVVVDAAMDWLRGCLDPLLTEAADTGVVLTLPTPPLWPHHLPTAAELTQLQREFAGAPLEAVLYSDWRHAESCLAQAGDVESPEEASGGGALVIPTQAEVLAVGSGVPLTNVLAVRSNDEASGATNRLLRLADACGLMVRLPLGVGEIPWSELSSEIEQAAEVTLALDHRTSRAELDASLQLIG